MAVPMTSSAFRSIVEDSLNDIFEQVYSERSDEFAEKEYIKEVDFGED